MANHNIPGTFVIGVFVDDILCSGYAFSVVKWFQLVLSGIFLITIKSDVNSFFGHAHYSESFIQIYLFISTGLCINFNDTI